MPNVQYIHQQNVKLEQYDIGDDFERYLKSLVADVKANKEDTLKNISQEAAEYHLNCGGKRIRANIAIKACAALGLNKQDSFSIAAIAELLHNGSLVHDDIQDGDKTRRGHETVWAKYGKAIAICTGDLFISSAYAALADISKTELIPAMINLVHQQIMATIRGQSIDVNHKINAIRSVASYEAVVIAKSGALLSLPLQLALIASNHSEHLRKAEQIANAFALIYQIADDLNDVHIDMHVGDYERYDETRQLKDCRALNIIFILQNIAGESSAKDILSNSYEVTNEAKQMALKKANECIRIAQDLPNNCGLYIQTLALDLKAKLIN
jgi:geranylgeranyl pyrophosphate synthase